MIKKLTFTTLLCTLAWLPEAKAESNQDCLVQVDHFSFQYVGMLHKTSLNIHLKLSPELLEQGIKEVGFRYRTHSLGRYNRVIVSDWLTRPAWVEPESNKKGEYEISLRYLKMRDRTEGNFFVRLNNDATYIMTPRLQDAYVAKSEDGALYYSFDDGNIKKLGEAKKLPASYYEPACSFEGDLYILL